MIINFSYVVVVKVARCSSMLHRAENHDLITRVNLVRTFVGVASLRDSIASPISTKGIGDIENTFPITLGAFSSI